MRRRTISAVQSSPADDVMKIIIDLQCCQTAARDRGMGRYSLSLARAIATQGRQHDFIFLLNAKYPRQAGRLFSMLSLVERLGETVFYDYPDLDGLSGQDRVAREQIATALRNDRVASMSPDIFHISSIFEGEGIFGPAPGFFSLPKGDFLNSATIYDFIPSVFPDQYLQDPVMLQWYNRCLSLVGNLDLGLAISDSSRKDAARFAGHPLDKTINIFGGVDESFRVLPKNELKKGEIWRRLALDSNFILYVGGPDYRKNIYFALEAFAKSRHDISEDYRFVVVYAVEKAEANEILNFANKLGIARYVDLTGYVTDEELVELYNGCSLFLFPSLYEGLGLPVIEAMRCGAPVLVGDNSSLSEIVTEADYRFDAGDPNDIRLSIVRALGRPGALDRMRSYSRQRAEVFTWRDSARKTIDFWEEAVKLTRRKTPRPKARPRVAMFTPLPNAKTGIADYSAEFIPKLARFAAIDVYVEDLHAVDFRMNDINISHHSQFSRFADGYDVIVYQIGNSPFHHYMLPYLSEYPGVVVLHDAYLGHLMHNPAASDLFVRENLARHGASRRNAVAHMSDATQMARNLIQLFPSAAVVAQRSIGVIVHSQFARRIVMADSRAAVLPEIAVIPQYRAPRQSAKRVSRAEARRQLGVLDDEILIISLGHVASTKGIIELIEAFGLSKTPTKKRARLVFVGELEGGRNHDTPYAQDVLKRVANDKRIFITGFATKEGYDTYIAAADIGVQLRTITRGETSGAILNLISNGVPLIYNVMGPTGEIPDEIAFRLEDWEPGSVAEALDKLIGDARLRSDLRERSLEYAADQLDPNVIGSAFVDTIVGMAKRSGECGPAVVSHRIAGVLRHVSSSADLVDQAARAYVRQERSELSPRLLFDVTHIREGDLKTGVQRVVRELVGAAYADEDLALQPQTFAFTEGGVISADDYAQELGIRLPIETADILHGPLDLRPFDTMLLADGTWHLSDLMREPISRLNAIGGRAYGLVHDILPLQHPDMFLDHVVTSVSNWLSLLVEQGAGLCCTSVCGAEALISHIHRNYPMVRPGLRVGVARLGADFMKGPKDKERSSVLETLRPGSPLFVVVGTLEPRKGHDYVLHAFERLWADGVDATLVFAGKQGWNVGKLMERIEKHPEKGRRFFYMGFVSDAAIADLYSGATGVIVSSLAEGFGLPIYEAARFGASLLLSDIPVFKELGGEHATYFRAGSSEQLARVVKKSAEGKGVSSRAIVPPTWDECAADVFDFVKGRKTFFSF
jgi:glycosyltransferase involved in cell wall biosynthesis